MSRVDFPAFMEALSPDYFWTAIGEFAGELGGGILYPRFDEVYEYDDSAATYTSIYKNLQDQNHFGTQEFFTFGAAVDDAIYFGFRRAGFSSLAFNMVDNNAHSGSTAVLAWEFWNGSTWTAVTGLTDNTNDFTSSGVGPTTVSYGTTGWALTTVNSDGFPRFYVRARLTSGSYVDPVIITEARVRENRGHSGFNRGTAVAPDQLLLYEPNNTIGGSPHECSPNSSFIRTDLETDYDWKWQAWHFDNKDMVNLDLTMELGPIDYKDVFGLSFGYWYKMAYQGHMNDTVDGTFPDQLGFTCGFNYDYKNDKLSREIEFSVVDEFDDTNELGPYLRVRLFDNNEAAPDNRGLEAGETFIMRDPSTGEPWRWEFHDTDPAPAAYQHWRNDRSSRIYFVGFSLFKAFLPDGTEYWKCAFYQNGRYMVAGAEEGVVPHEILHQTPGLMYFWNMYDDGTGEPPIERTNPHWTQYPFLFKRALSQEEWDNIYYTSCRQDFGLTGTWDLVTAPAPPIRDIHHQSELRASQIRRMHHEHHTVGNAVFVPPVTSKTFRLILTGAADSTTDIQVPMRSMSVSKNLAEEQAASFQVPFRAELLEAIKDRPNGTLQLDHGTVKSDGSVVFTNYLTAAQGDTAVSEGVKKATISLEGTYEVPTPGAPTTVALADSQIVRVNVDGDVRTLTAEFDPTLLPGDTVTYKDGAENFEVRQVSVEGDISGSCVMRLSEAGDSG